MIVEEIFQVLEYQFPTKLFHIGISRRVPLVYPSAFQFLITKKAA